MTVALDFAVPPQLAASGPPEARGLGRDGVRLLVGGPGELSHHRFRDLPELLAPGDVLVVNTSATLPAAVDVADRELALHVSTELPDGSWLVELRRRDHATTMPAAVPTDLPADLAAGSDEPAERRLPLVGGGWVTLRSRYAGGRLWVARLDVASVPGYLQAHGHPIRYGYVANEWPLSTYQTVFATEPGSAEMPSAGRPFTTELVTRLVARGIVVAPVTLHTGVASLETSEPPYPERFAVPASTARLVTQARAAGERVVAVGTTVVRALETAAGPDAVVRPAAGWTDLVVTPQRGVRVVDGLLTGFHEPRASHLELLAAVAGAEMLTSCYTEALAAGYRWHEFGDLNLLLTR